MERFNNRYFEELWELDWSFRVADTDPLAGAHWYPARFIPQMPGILLGYLSRGGRVLDPFCGSGTTLVEARRRGLPCVGIDTNPVATSIAGAKGLSVSLSSYRRYLSRLERYATEASGRSTEYHLPHDELSNWFHPQTLVELASLKLAIDIVESKYRLLAVVCFSAMQRSVCSQEKHWGWICDNVRPRTLTYKPVFDEFFLRAKTLGGQVAALPEVDEYTVINGSAHQALAEVAGCSFESIVTSPPYLGTIDYIRSQRLSLYWMGVDPDSIKFVETGARFKRHRKRALEEFLDELRLAFEQCFRVLIWGGVMAMVLGESPSRDPYMQEVAVMLKELGFVAVTDSRRSVSVQRSFSPSVRSEMVSLWMKPH